MLWTALAAAVLAAPGAAHDRRVRTLSGDFATAGVERVDLRLPPGSVRIEPSPDGRVRVELDVLCSFDSRRCEERAERLALRASHEGNTLDLRVEGAPSLRAPGLHLRGRILVPPRKALEVDFPVGELRIDGVEGDLHVDAGVGEVAIVMGERHVRSVRLGVGIGEASLSVEDRRIEGSGWLGHKVRWGEGAGPSRVAVSLGVGEIDVKLE
jgi:hypothetical protein